MTLKQPLSARFSKEPLAQTAFGLSAGLHEPGRASDSFDLVTSATLQARHGESAATSGPNERQSYRGHRTNASQQLYGGIPIPCGSPSLPSRVETPAELGLGLTESFDKHAIDVKHVPDISVNGDTRARSLTEPRALAHVVDHHHHHHHQPLYFPVGSPPLPDHHIVSMQSLPKAASQLTSPHGYSQSPSSYLPSMTSKYYQPVASPDPAHYGYQRPHAVNAQNDHAGSVPHQRAYSFSTGYTTGYAPYASSSASNYGARLNGQASHLISPTMAYPGTPGPSSWSSAGSSYGGSARSTTPGLTRHQPYPPTAQSNGSRSYKTSGAERTRKGSLALPPEIYSPPSTSLAHPGLPNSPQQNLHLMSGYGPSFAGGIPHSATAILPFPSDGPPPIKSTFTSGRRSSNGKATRFVATMIELLNDPDRQDYIRWTPDGDAWICDPTHPSFVPEVLEANFSHKNLSSFARQLNAYGFKHLSADEIPDEIPDSERGQWKGYRHQLFHRDQQNGIHLLRPRARSQRRESDVLPMVRSPPPGSMRRDFTRPPRSFTRSLTSM
ncbi:uncharacterized protein L969DRAFT_73394 [Mixia osmundae IAM 14324]|uniref:HSF-type DNA-binding domain-containing protein n=1 Tax=Mixia osmundae (strain CBS 9802 / IAM 14324 / JCM 22182 / KY 12970) TaxID=764103 RepID=G7E9V6_MIXOS|nr:uncharacterized protein L969DRAFT_73394 [Mixia osmundae IAM 14324]KEI40057.1 hypothetical protein L969DRAFT_73394 [Mixia osmundae IAM 14324]GAA99425.1 hypothetical protein E5Q_06123 [Mixia osmundae IAM 14324]